MDLGNLTAYLGLEADGFDKGLEGSLGKLEEFGSKGVVKAAAAGVAIAGAVAGAVVSGMDMEQANDKLAAQLGLSADDSARIGKLAGTLYSQNYGDSLEGVNDAVGAVMSSISGMRGASSSDLQAVTADALNFASAMNVDVSEAATSAGALVNTGLAKNATQAFDLLTAGAQKAGPAMVGPILDATNEYSKHFQMLGFDGQQAMGILSTAASGGEISIDKAGDAIKEFGIRATDLTDANASGAFDELNLNAKTMADDLLAGGDKAQQATAKIAQGLLGIKDPAKQAATVTALFGTQAEDIGKQNMPAFLSALAGAPSALGDVTGAAKRMGDTLNDNASSNLTSFKRQAQMAFVEVLGGKVLPVVNDVAASLSSNFAPAAAAIGDVLTTKVGPALHTVFDFLGQHQTTVTVIASIIGTVLVGAFVAWGVAATVNAAKNVAAWLSAALSSEAGAATTELSAAQVGLSWLAMGARAVGQAALVVASWASTAAGAVLSAATTVASWVAAGIQTGITLAVMAAQFVAQGAVMVASALVTAAGVVAGWVLMGAQAMLQAARMAAAWFIALGPIGWVIAAVIGLVALIIANWDTVVSWTTTAWSAVTGALAAAWEWIKGAASAALGFLVDLFLNFTGPGLIIKHWDDIVAATSAAWAAVSGFVSGAIEAVVGFVVALPGRVLAALADLGSGLLDLATTAWGLFSGAVNAVVEAVVAFVQQFPGRIWNALAGIGQGLADLATKAWGLFSAAVSAGFDAVVGFATGLAGRVVTGLATLGTEIAGVATKAWALFSTAVSTAVGDVLSFVAGIPAKIVTQLGDVGSLLLSAGENIIKGLLQGIKNMAGSIADAVLGPIKSAVGGVKSFLGINSPSRLFAEIGTNVGAGLVLGMDGMRGEVSDSMAALADTRSLAAVSAPALSALANAQALASLAALPTPPLATAPSPQPAPALVGASASSPDAAGVTFTGPVTLRDTSDAQELAERVDWLARTRGRRR